ncbi:hypothetical protein DXX93_08930 [Thalassotalea euphylliae]|uniref:Uncharacterized protein n=1 Tax=Thalassotalea euphylliae TaxID=1655234 RepID=A0A3E0TQ29_9GAMM|nr:hypothetical protein [Thalassotalea euphylliae]REL26686.1 hypothetical protein DXX93_08930 [Thalassotalea euphylliae]
MDKDSFELAKHTSTLSLTLLAIVFVAADRIKAFNSFPWLESVVSAVLSIAFVTSIVSMLFNSKKDAKSKETSLVLSRFSAGILGAIVFATLLKLF